MSDKHGRKNLIILGSVGTVLSILMFGFSTSLWWAILSRFLSGLLNGNLGISKSLIGEISNSQTQAQSFGLMGVGWAIGSILGASFGGLLARPAVKWPHAFGETIFERFPYFARKCNCGVNCNCRKLYLSKRTDSEERSCFSASSDFSSCDENGVFDEKHIVNGVCLRIGWSCEYV